VPSLKGFLFHDFSTSDANCGRVAGKRGVATGCDLCVLWLWVCISIAVGVYTAMFFLPVLPTVQPKLQLTRKTFQWNHFKHFNWLQKHRKNGMFEEPFFYLFRMNSKRNFSREVGFKSFQSEYFVPEEIGFCF